ncbi:hypothetical protein P170DRAFT_129410 [Aspergillus steynii IBT 23096]|uniref:Protein efr3 n=1 Tax=Aspergillus steynii IBT 23096 TaxID=1392250 RepID=A0A2I2GKI8_9EURO|nr:uncharacterized protein P170DRAFT_129410 [Aspergillus steynii IBT 23096]PLB53402.1 hypothetical protein P170DRAFT_129410 [Aspergillus steynii IBT 23096]
MEGVRQKCRPKHQVLILKCYPQYQKGVQYVKPNSSELSYLLYYASTRRSKLTKVGAFLEKRAARDVWRRKIGNVQVTLQILSALIEKVPRDLPIYARSVMTVIETVLRSRDITMVEDSISTFEMFCSHQDMAALSAEQDFANQYREVVRTYASFADIEASSQARDASSPQLAIRWRNAGLRAIKGVISSEAGLAADGGDSLNIILPVILQNLYNGEDDLLLTLERKLLESEKAEADLMTRPRRVSTATVENVDAVDGDPTLAARTTADMDRQAEMDVRLLALSCLERIIVTGSGRGQIRVTTKIVLDFILRKGKTDNRAMSLNTKDTWETSLIELVAKWCPVQVRFIILAAAMELLLELKPTEDSLNGPFTIMYMIDRLLKSPVNMIGLSVIDILLGLMQYMSFLVSPSRAEKTTEEASEKQNGHSDTMGEPSAKKQELLSLLQNCIGDLTTHIYYGDQVVDMIRAILTRLRPSSSNEQTENSAFPTQLDGFGPSASSPGSGEKKHIVFFSPSAKVTALKAIKNVLLVANSKKPAEAAGVESRHRVGSYVWEGTQWLLREPNKTVRYAYVDAFLAWLRMETNQDDLKVKEKPGKHSQSPKRELTDIAEKPGKRTVSSNTAQRERALIMAQSNFLRLLHLTIYDIALQFPQEKSEIMLLHLLLVSLVDKLGVNAARYGLPMVLKLQDDLTTVDSVSSGIAQVNIASLVFGYLWALTEKFDLENCHVGGEIMNEIVKRQKYGIWVEQIRLPAASLNDILQDRTSQSANFGMEQIKELTPFGYGIEELVNRLEEAYNGFILSTTHSPPTSPGRSFTTPILAQVSSAGGTPKGSLLPSTVKEQMLSAWSRETCLAAAEKDKAEALSLSGSKSGTMAMRSHIYHNGHGDSSPSTVSPASAHHGVSGGAAGLPNVRRTSAPNSSGSQLNDSNRDSPVHVNELRRVLSVNNEGKRRLSPLRGRLDTANSSVVSSSSESMNGHSGLESDGIETPKASALTYGSQYSFHSGENGPDVIPPVPPIPPSLSIPGGFPNESQRSLASAERPSTAPGRPRRKSSASAKAQANATAGRSLSRHKSRSSTGLAAAADDDEHPKTNGHEDTDPTRNDVQKLLGGFLSPMDAESRKVVGRSRTGRRSATGGIGRPPY